MLRCRLYGATLLIYHAESLPLLITLSAVPLVVSLVNLDWIILEKIIRYWMLWYNIFYITKWQLCAVSKYHKIKTIFSSHYYFYIVSFNIFIWFSLNGQKWQTFNMSRIIKIAMGSSVVPEKYIKGHLMHFSGGNGFSCHNKSGCIGRFLEAFKPNSISSSQWNSFWPVIAQVQFTEKVFMKLNENVRKRQWSIVNVLSPSCTIYFFYFQHWYTFYH